MLDNKDLGYVLDLKFLGEDMCVFYPYSFGHEMLLE